MNTVTDVLTVCAAVVAVLGVCFGVPVALAKWEKR